MKVSVLGPTDKEVFPLFFGMSKEQAEQLCNSIGKVIAETGYEFIMVPDKGVAELVAKGYRENNGKKVIGLVPHDPLLSSDHLKPYLHLVDERIDCESWDESDRRITADAEVLVVVGLSGGVFKELGWIKYNKKIGTKLQKIFSFVDLPPVLVREFENNGIEYARLQTAEELTEKL